MDRIGRYEILGRIGAGGFATVYRVRDPVLDSEVAAKVLAENWTGTLEIRERFIREAQLLRRIDSDRVVTVHDIGELPSGQPYFVMALADQGTLDDRLDRGLWPSPDDVASIAQGMADCITVVHSHGLIHRDIKPSNLLIAASRSGASREPGVGLLASWERLVLGDFGLAKDIALQNTGLTIAAGSLGYAAPEQMSPNGNPDHQTDLYAATGVMYRVLTGTRPPNFDLVNRIVSFPDQQWWMEGSLGQFFRRGMTFLQEERHHSIDAWLAELTVAMAPFNAAPPKPEAAVPQSRTLSPPIEAPLEPVGQGSADRHAPLRDVQPPTVPLRDTPPHPDRHPSQPVDRVSPVSGPRFDAIGSSGGQVAGDITPHRPRRSRRWFLLAAASLVAAAGVAGGYYLLGGSGPVIEGPDQITAGEPVVYSARYAGTSTFEWTDPNGRPVAASALTVSGIVPGSIEITVVAVTNGSRSPVTTKVIDVLPARAAPVIEGPDTIAVNKTETYTYSGAPAGAKDPEWRDPIGGKHSGPKFNVTAQSPGPYRIVLIVTLPDGTQIGTAKDVTLIE